MSGPLITDRSRVSLAAIYGVAAPPLLFEAGAAIFFAVTEPASLTSFHIFEAPRLYMIGLVISGVLFAVFGTPAWLILHRRGARSPHATLAGAVVGFLIPPLAVILFQILMQQPIRDPARTLVGVTGFSLAGAAIGALTAFGVWRIAYRTSSGPSIATAIFE